MTRPWERRGKAALPGWTSTIPTEKPRSRTERHASRNSFAPSPWFSPSMPWTCPTGRRRASAGRIAPLLERARTSPSTTWGSPAPQIPPLCAQCRYVVRFIFLKFCLRVCSLRIAEGTSNESVCSLELSHIDEEASLGKTSSVSLRVIDFSRCWGNPCWLWRPTGKPTRIMSTLVNKWSPYDRTWR